jgi:hypothetical protein
VRPGEGHFRSKDDGDAESFHHGPGIPVEPGLCRASDHHRTEEPVRAHRDRAFQKWYEVWPMPTKQAAKVAEAFLGVMMRFGACAEVPADNGTEFQGEFEQLCQKLFLDHRWTLRYHPQSNGLKERLVRTIKTRITKYRMENDRRTWDEWLPYLVMGYRMSNQAALGQNSPYYYVWPAAPYDGGRGEAAAGRADRL